jgi:hypothetical protein
MLGCTFWIHSQWDARRSPDPARHLLRALFRHPGPGQGAQTMLKAIVLLSFICFGVKFGLMIRIDDF